MTKRMVFHKVAPRDWIQVKYEGRTYMVCIRTLLNAYRKEKDHD